ncbi:thioredoxin family protein [Brevibacillus sp. NRS-1366]|uniref:thioredoxin family protein n=1 Tax=Brevibacillus sp. NRS-1366 TaxID=3233899 RepID=UPI003D194452
MGKIKTGRLVIVLGFVISVLGIFWGIYYYAGLQKNTFNNENSGGNPYEKEVLHQETIKQLNDPLYQNIILPKELDKRIQNNNEPLYVYFYSPKCTHCLKATPKLMQVANQLDKEVLMFNLLEFENGWDDYQIEATPTLVTYEKGLESLRLIGDQDSKSYEQFFLLK